MGVTAISVGVMILAAAPPALKGGGGVAHAAFPSRMAAVKGRLLPLFGVLGSFSGLLIKRQR